MKKFVGLLALRQKKDRNSWRNIESNRVGYTEVTRQWCYSSFNTKYGFLYYQRKFLLINHKFNVRSLLFVHPKDLPRSQKTESVFLIYENFFSDNP